MCAIANFVIISSEHYPQDPVKCSRHIYTNISNNTMNAYSIDCNTNNRKRICTRWLTNFFSRTAQNSVFFRGQLIPLPPDNGNNNLMYF
jgi:hypothetical protein